MLLNDAAFLESVLVRAAEISGTKVLGSKFHRFEPQGITGVLLLSESHASVHTWPETGMAAVDFFTCKEGGAKIAAEYLRTAFKAPITNLRVIERGADVRDVGGRNFLIEGDALAGSGMVLPIERILSFDPGPPQELRVFETGDSRGRAMDIDGIVMLTERDEAFFHEILVHVPLGACEKPEKILVIGGGDGGAVREIVKYPSVREILVCDYDERVVTRSREFFPNLAKSFDDPRVRLEFRDAVEFVKTLPDESFDAVVIDGNGPFPNFDGGLFSPSFYADVARILKTGGFVSTFAGTPVSDAETYRKILRTLRGIFPSAEPYLSYVPMYDTGCWGNALASKTPRPDEFPPLPPGNYRYCAPGVREAAFVVPEFARA